MRISTPVATLGACPGDAALQATLDAAERRHPSVCWWAARVTVLHQRLLSKPSLSLLRAAVHLFAAAARSPILHAGVGQGAKLGNGAVDGDKLSNEVKCGKATPREAGLAVCEDLQGREAMATGALGEDAEAGRQGACINGTQLAQEAQAGQFLLSNVNARHAVRAALAIETALMWQRYGMIAEASRSLHNTADALGASVGVCGALGTRTEFQEQPLAQLVLRFERLDSRKSADLRGALGAGRPLEEVEPRLEGGGDWAGWKDDSGVNRAPRLVDADGMHFAVTAFTHAAPPSNSPSLATDKSWP
jgi:hypothetical protein